jgi:adenylate cyclase
MSKISLKSILNKRKSTAALLEKLAAELDIPFSIQDRKGRWLWGEETPGTAEKFPIQSDTETIGWLHGDARAASVATLLNHLVAKESEKKQMGSEVLDLYREINLIYKFSEKLANALDAEMIAQTALEEVQQLVEASGGAVIFFPEKEGEPYFLAKLGEEIFAPEDLNSQSPLHEYLHSGQADIQNNVQLSLGENRPPLHSLLYAPLKVKHRMLGLIILGSEEAIEYNSAHLKLLTTLALQSASAIESALLFQKRIQEAEEREEAMRRIHEVTTRFVPYEFISALGREKLTEVMLGDQVQRDVTVFFSDIRDYTTLAESMSPEDNFRFVSAYNSRMGPVIYENQGFVNQYLGDGIMAIFPKSPYDALRAAVQMQEVIRIYNRERREMNREPIQVGMGLHTGPLIMGIIGDMKRMEAATIADTVNTAARVESLTKYYGTNILLSEESLQLISELEGQDAQNEPFHFRYLGRVQVKGKRDPVGIYECFDGDLPALKEKKLLTAKSFSEAMRHYYRREFKPGIEAIDALLAINPDDLTARRLRGRMEKYMHTGLPEDWNGVEKMSSK